MTVIRRAAPAPRSPRFVVRHNNQTFHVLDTVKYTAVRSRPSAAKAQADADYLNSRPSRGPSARAQVAEKYHARAA